MCIGSTRGVAAIHHNDRAGEKTRKVAGHVGEKTRDLVGRRDALDGVIVFEHLPIFFGIARSLGGFMDDRRVDRAAGDRVDANSVGGVLNRHLAGHLMDRAFCGAIRTLSGVAYYAGVSAGFEEYAGIWI